MKENYNILKNKSILEFIEKTNKLSLVNKANLYTLFTEIYICVNNIKIDTENNVEVATIDYLTYIIKRLLNDNLFSPYDISSVMYTLIEFSNIRIRNNYPDDPFLNHSLRLMSFVKEIIMCGEIKTSDDHVKYITLPSFSLPTYIFREQ